MIPNSFGPKTSDEKKQRERVLNEHEASRIIQYLSFALVSNQNLLQKEGSLFCSEQRPFRNLERKGKRGPGDKKTDLLKP